MSDSRLRDLERRFSESGASDDGIRLRVARKRAGQSAPFDARVVSSYEVVRLPLEKYSYGFMIDGLQSVASESQPFVNGRYRPLSLAETLEALTSGRCESAHRVCESDYIDTCSAVRYSGRFELMHFDIISVCDELIARNGYTPLAQGVDCASEGVRLSRAASSPLEEVRVPIVERVCSVQLARKVRDLYGVSDSLMTTCPRSLRTRVLRLDVDEPYTTLYIDARFKLDRTSWRDALVVLAR